MSAVGHGGPANGAHANGAHPNGAHPNGAHPGRAHSSGTRRSGHGAERAAAGRPAPSRRGGLLLALSGWLAVVVVGAGAPVALRTLAVFGFTVVGPGLAMTAFLHRKDWLERLALTIALSLSTGVLVTESLALAHLFSALTALVVLASLTTVLVAAHDRDDLTDPVRRGGRMIATALLGSEEQRRAAVTPRSQEPEKERLA